MDRICVAVLDRIRALSPAGRYVIIEGEELFEAFPDGSETSDRELDRALTLLRNDGYIDMKYSRGDTYCIAPLKEYAPEEPPEAAYAEEKPRGRRRFADPVFVSAFAGGAIGSLLISLIFALV